MNNMNKKTIVVTIVAAIVAVIAIIITVTPIKKRLFNMWEASFIEEDLNSSWKEVKQVEDTLRAYVASYESDKVTYETMKVFEDEVAQETARAALIRANQTATVYNEYYLKNSKIWKDRVPADIRAQLEIIAP